MEKTLGFFFGGQLVPTSSQITLTFKKVIFSLSNIEHYGSQTFHAISSMFLEVTDFLASIFFSLLHEKYERFGI